MSSPAPAFEQLALSPLGAGDLIDRTIRLYRRHFTTLIRAAAPPVVIAAAGSVLWTVARREGPLAESTGALTLFILMGIAGALLIIFGNFCFLLVMGGASRNLVLHLLRGEPVSAAAIYRNVRARFWGLVGSLLLILMLAGVIIFPILFIWLMVIGIVITAIVSVSGDSVFGVVLAVVVSLAATLGSLFLFFLVMGRVAYVPQVMLVEGRGVFDSLSRSISLARGNVRRLTAMFLFTTFATYSVLMLLVIPLGWLGYLQGINPLTFDEANLPLWYSLAQQVVTQAASILLAPVWMLGLSLLYVDERVRHEGYDIELMAAQRLGEMPELPGGGEAPLAPAVHTGKR
ncbi:MAG TPA: hypothetical protein VIP46_19885, partial [Pyrinomonadaceae bacterium]